ncbi:MAG: lipopolysaccharide heptosyltransferase II [Candidatus Zixiibacteriota bacterium]
MNRIAVRMPNWLGDAVMATPALQALHELFPNAAITILVRENLVELSASCPFVEEIISLPKVSSGRKISQPFSTASVLKKKKFDLAVCFPHSFSSAWMFGLAKIPQRVGFSAEGRKVFLTQSLPYPLDGKRPHRVRFYGQLIELIAGRKLTIPTLQVWPRLLNEKETEDLDKKVGGFQNFVAVAPGSVGPAKRWFADRFAEVVKKLVGEKKMRVVLVGAPHDRPSCDEVARLLGVFPINLAGETSLSELYFLFQKSRLFLGNDSGAGHVAVACGIPVIVLAGAGDPEEIAPWTDKKTVLFKKIFCSPCYRHTCRRKDHPLECMDLIGIDDVWRAVEFWLAKPGMRVGTS